MRFKVDTRSGRSGWVSTSGPAAVHGMRLSWENCQTIQARDVEQSPGR